MGIKETEKVTWKGRKRQRGRIRQKRVAQREESEGLDIAEKTKRRSIRRKRI
jgi:hypothetical protein